MKLTEHYAREFDKFTAHIAKWKHTYKWAVCQYVAIKGLDGNHLFSGRIVFEPTSQGLNLSPLSFESEHILAERHVFKIEANEIATILEEAKEGRIKIKDKLISLIVKQDNHLSVNFSFVDQSIVNEAIYEGFRLPSLRIDGDRKYELLAIVGDELLDWELKATDKPFYNLGDLLMHFGLPAYKQTGDSTSFEVIAKAPGLIENTSRILEDNAIIDCIVASNLNTKKIKMGYRLFKRDEIERGKIDGHLITWILKDEINIGHCEIPAENTSVAQLFLSYEEIAFHQSWIIDPDKHLNPRHGIHQLFDRDLKILSELLFQPDADKATDFEFGISSLLNLLGFTVSNYGRIKKLQDGPDIIITTPAGHIGVIECTLGLLNNKDKLSKLVHRTNAIKEKMLLAGYGHLRIQPAIVTPLSKEAVSADFEKAGKHGIAVICKEDLENFLKQVTLFPNAEKLFEDAIRLIPGNDQGKQFKFL